jgi:O-acetyl-ADP-ribose deacetylase (regulator of RNase III)
VTTGELRRVASAIIEGCFASCGHEGGLDVAMAINELWGRKLELEWASKTGAATGMRLVRGRG